MKQTPALYASANFVIPLDHLSLLLSNPASRHALTQVKKIWSLVSAHTNETVAPFQQIIQQMLLLHLQPVTLQGALCTIQDLTQYCFVAELQISVNTFLGPTAQSSDTRPKFNPDKETLGRASWERRRMATDAPQCSRCLSGKEAQNRRATLSQDQHIASLF